jgi:hypothetical protein
MGQGLERVEIFRKIGLHSYTATYDWGDFVPGQGAKLVQTPETMIDNNQEKRVK